MLEMLLGAVKAVVTLAVSAIGGVVVQTIKELERTATGKVLTQAAQSWVQTKTRAGARAKALAEEEEEFGKKMSMDRKLSSSDLDRMREIKEEREELREQHAKADAAKLAEELSDRDARQVILSADELISTIGLLHHKKCRCGAMMSVSSTYSTQYDTRKDKFMWRCPSCGKREYFDPMKDAATIVRTADPDLDLPEAQRQKLWNEPSTLAQANARLRSHMGEEDKDVICPHHLLPMRLFPNLSPGQGRLLESFAYSCIGMNADGRGCTYRVPIDRLAIASSALRRLEGRGLIQ